MSLLNIFDSSILALLETNACPNKAFVYIADIGKYTNHLSYFWESLSDSEQEHARSYYTKSLANSYIISHGILRCILSYYTKQLPKNIQFTNNKYGKPSLKDSNIKFNMSHSHDIACYIVAFNNNVGIDIEFYNSALDIMELSKLVLAPKETVLFKFLEPDKQRNTFYNLWTKKEALIKAIGEGLSYPISTIEALPIVQYDKITLTSIENNNKQELYTYLLRVLCNYSGAIATEKKINEIVYIKTHNQYGIFDKISSVYLHY